MLGPWPVDPSESVASLREVVAQVVKKPHAAVLLTHRGDILRPEDSLAASGVGDGAALFAIFASAEEFFEAAKHALAECPRGEGHWVPRMDPEEHVGPEHQAWVAEHRSWVEGGVRVVREQLELCVGVDSYYREAAANFVLRVLEVPSSLCRRGDQVFEDTHVPWGTREYCSADAGLVCPEELYPDELTFRAAQLLPQLVEAGDPRAWEVITRWLFRRTASCWTWGEILRLSPEFLAGVDRSLRRAALKHLLLRGGCLMATEDPECVCAHVERGEEVGGPVWEVKACYWAIVGIWADEDASMVLDAFLNNKRHDWQNFFKTYPELNAHPTTMPEKRCAAEEAPDEEEEWMAEYMYKRS